VATASRATSQKKREKWRTSSLCYATFYKTRIILSALIGPTRRHESLKAALAGPGCNIAMSMTRCKAITKAGDQCRNNAIPGTGFCYMSSHGKLQKTLGQRFRNFVANNWLALVLASLPFLLTAYWEFHHERLNATSGVVTAPHEESPMAVSIGSAQFVMLSKDGVVFSDGKAPLLTIHLIDGRLLVSTQIRDETGSLIAEMKDNEWKQGPAIFDRNYTRDVLEIRDRTGKVALQVANLGRTVEVSAIFHCPNGWTYLAGSIAGEGSGIELRRQGQPLTSEIPPICDYPSDLHLGSCPGVDLLSQELTSRLHTIYALYAPVRLCLDAPAQSPAQTLPLN
jgi:hypothetical protein